MKKYDYLIVGAGLFGAVFAHEAKEAGKTCLVIDKRNHIAGNIYTDKVKDIDVHQYGAHIFHTSNETVWNYVNRFAKFNRYTNSPVANYKGEIYNMPFNMNTFNKLWGVVTPQEAQAKIEEQKKAALSQSSTASVWSQTPAPAWSEVLLKLCCRGGHGSRAEGPGGAAAR